MNVRINPENHISELHFIHTVTTPAQLANLGHSCWCSWSSLESGFSDVYPFIMACRVNSVLHEIKPSEQIPVSVTPLRARNVGLWQQYR